MSQAVIGYTVNITSDANYQQLIEQGNCQEVIVATPYADYYEQFKEFLFTYKDQSLVVLNYQSMGLQLMQLRPALQLIADHQIEFHIIEKKLASTRQYLDVLHDLAIKEKEVISWRTRIGLERAQQKGVVRGRPALDAQIIHQIQTLFHVHRKSLQEISIKCGVSLGTVYKYTKQQPSSKVDSH